MTVDDATKNRFQKMFPDAVPWRDRVRTDPLALALMSANATDAEAADMYAAAYEKMYRERLKLLELVATPMRWEGAQK